MCSGVAIALKNIDMWRSFSHHKPHPQQLSINTEVDFRFYRAQMHMNSIRHSQIYSTVKNTKLLAEKLEEREKKGAPKRKISPKVGSSIENKPNLDLNHGLKQV